VGVGVFYQGFSSRSIKKRKNLNAANHRVGMLKTPKQERDQRKRVNLCPFFQRGKNKREVARRTILEKNKLVEEGDRKEPIL